jgi:hypothetical protein
MLLRKNVVVDKTSTTAVTLLFEDGQRLSLPREEFGEAVEVDAPFVVQLTPSEQASDNLEILSRTILNQLLGDGPRRSDSGEPTS